MNSDFGGTLLPSFAGCRQFWIPGKATFGHHCVGIVAYVPVLISLLILLRYALLPLWRRRPRWLHNFAAEEVEKSDVIPPRRKWPSPCTTLLLISATGALFSVIVSVARFQPLYLVPVVPCIVSCIVIAIDRPSSTPAPLLLHNLGLLLAQLFLSTSLVGMPLPLDACLWCLQIAIPLTNISFILRMPMRDPELPAHEASMPSTTPTSSLRSPEDDFSLWDWMSVSWMSPLISLCGKRQIHDEDVWSLPFEFQHSRLHLSFRELKGSVLARLLVANGRDLVFTSFLGIVTTIAELVQIVFLQQLLAALRDGQRDVRAAMVYTALTLFARLVDAQAGVFSTWFSRRAYERSRGEMITMIYEKTLRRKAFTFPGLLQQSDACPASVITSSATSDIDPTESEIPLYSNGIVSKPTRWQRIRTCFGLRKQAIKAPVSELPPLATTPASMGKVLNLMRNDAYEIAQRFWEFPNLFTIPSKFVLSLVLIWLFLGPAAFLGIFVLIGAQLVNSLIIRQVLRWERTRRAVTDMKLQVTNQFVEAIRHLRWYDWQDKWLGQILDARQKELNLMIFVNLLNRAITFFNQLAVYFFPVAAFYAYTVIGGHKLSVDVAFPALNLFTLLNMTLKELPALLGVLMNARVAMGRIEDFMHEPEKEDVYLEGSTGPLDELKLQILNGTFAWPGTERKALKDISIVFPIGLTVICGKVGAGKSALLQAILGELDQLGGERTIPEEMIGYCTQAPWLQSMSIRENILFSAPYDSQRYRQVLDACCLLPDLQMFQAGDLSNIGENGIGLSGGQKARVALARAVYSQSRILVLDDPIAALDHHTAESVLQRLFRSSLMKNRVVIFVSHRVDLVTPYANQFVEIVHGRAEILSEGELRLRQDMAQVEEDYHYDAPDTEQESSAVPEKFIEEERRAHGSVVASTYWRYIRAGKLKWWFMLIAVFALFRASRVVHYYFLKMWGEAYEQAQASLVIDPPHGSSSSWLDRLGIDLGLPSPSDNVLPWLFWFAMVASAQVLLSLVSDLIIVVIVYTAGKRLFVSVMRRVANATFRFYDVTPVGRLMNRLTSDIGTIDGSIVSQIEMVTWCVISWGTSLAVIASATPTFLVLAIVMSAGFLYVFNLYLPASQSLRRLEMVSLSPLMSNFGTLLEGLTTVRAFRAQPHFQGRIIRTTDAFQKMDHFYWSLQTWLQYRYDLISAAATFALTLFAVFGGLSEGTIAFVLAAAANFVMSTHTLCKSYGNLQMQFVSVERVIELLDLEEEAAGTVAPPAAWPTFGDDIVFDNATVRYAPQLEPALRGLSFRIPGGASVAVTGRTGSGKSTLALALLGTVLPDADGVGGSVGGRISVGGVDVARVDKHALRQRVSFVAQDPVLFPGTLRENLDPLGEHSEAECATVLNKVLGGGFGPLFAVDGGGKNLSQGQRQLVGLGRAVLRRSPIVVLDEATASIDVRTASDIQQVLREELRYSTVITVAHRVEAVKDAEWCLELEGGRVKRFERAR